MTFVELTFRMHILFCTFNHLFYIVFLILVDNDVKPSFSHSSRLAIPKSEEQMEALSLTTKTTKIVLETYECTSPTSTTEYNPKTNVTKEHKVRPTQGRNKVMKKIENNAGSKRIPPSPAKKECVKRNIERCSVAESSHMKAGKIAKICEEMEKIGESSVSDQNKEEVNAQAILVPLPIIHEEFRCRSENCFFRTRVRQELIQHIILEHDE